MTHNKIASQILARPILGWKDIDIWVYTLANSLPINMAYRFGLRRVGCLYCPHHTARVDWWLEQIYPKEMRKWKNYIVEYAKNKLRKLDPEYKVVSIHSEVLWIRAECYWDRMFMVAVFFPLPGNKPNISSECATGAYLLLERLIKLRRDAWN